LIYLLFIHIRNSMILQRH